MECVIDHASSSYKTVSGKWKTWCNERSFVENHFKLQGCDLSILLFKNYWRWWHKLVALLSCAISFDCLPSSDSVDTALMDILLNKVSDNTTSQQTLCAGGWRETIPRRITFIKSLADVRDGPSTLNDSWKARFYSNKSITRSNFGEIFGSYLVHEQLHKFVIRNPRLVCFQVFNRLDDASSWADLLLEISRLNEKQNEP